MRFAAAALIAALSFSASAKQTVRIAFIGPLTGGNSAIGLGGRNSADLAVRLRNADPKAKYQYELRGARRRVQAGRGRAGGDQGRRRTAPSSPASRTTARWWRWRRVETFHRFGLPTVVWGAVLPDITYANNYKEIHRVNGTMINQNDTDAKFMADHGYKKVAVIHDTTDYGKGHNKYFSQFFQKDGRQIVATFGVTADQQDFTAELTQIKALSPEVLYFGGLTPIGVRIRAQMDKLGLNAQFHGTSGIVTDDFIKGLGPLAEGALAFREGAPAEKLPGGKKFLENYDKQGYAQGAGGVRSVRLRRGGAAHGRHREGRARTGRRSSPSSANVKDRDSIVGKITFDDHGQNIGAGDHQYVVQDGKWLTWEESEYASGKRKLAVGSK